MSKLQEVRILTHHLVFDDANEVVVPDHVREAVAKRLDAYLLKSLMSAVPAPTPTSWPPKRPRPWTLFSTCQT